MTKIGYSKGPIRQKPKIRPNFQQIKSKLNNPGKTWTVNPDVARYRDGRLTVTIEGRPKDINKLFWAWRREGDPEKKGEQGR